MTILDHYKNRQGKFDLPMLKLLDQHNLLGYLYSRENEHLCSQGAELCKNKYQWQQALNLAILKEAQDINLKAQNMRLPIVFLKGTVLLNSVYTDLGERYLSDMDVYINTEDKQLLYTLMNEMGYKQYPAPRWELCAHKDDFSKTNESLVDMHIDIHYNILLDIPLSITSISHFVLPSPSLEILFFHLVTHLGYQHTYLRLNWLIDIYLLSEKYLNQIQWKKVYDLFLKYRLLNDLKTIQFLLKKYFDLELPINIFINKYEFLFLENVMTPGFLLQPQKNKFRYYLLKHYLKPSFMAAIKYDMYWILAKVRGDH
ncbi:MAG: nucleotidyltransferase family protein [Bdellovibrionaceae bacterium]|nr:nucleotidyltransferase family protein [Pseudobdellovibrionaceae bacterium]